MTSSRKDVRREAHTPRWQEEQTFGVLAHPFKMSIFCLSIRHSVAQIHTHTVDVRAGIDGEARSPRRPAVYRRGGSSFPAALGGCARGF